MIFWGLILLAVAGAAVVYWRSDFEPWLLVLGTLLLGAAGAFVIWFVFALTLPYNSDLISDETYKLKAVGTDSAISGRSFFLSGGYIDDKRVLNYISVRDDGGIRVERAEAEESVIFEGVEDATVTIRHYDHNNWWLQTWPIGDHHEYEFRIPTGSVLESYAVDNG